MDDGEVVAQAAAGRNLHLLTAALGPGSFRMEVTVRAVRRGPEFGETWAGFEFAIQGELDGYQNALVHPARSKTAGVRGDGRLFVGDAIGEEAITLDGPVTLALECDRSGVVRISAGDRAVEQKFDHRELTGNLALAAQAPGRATAETSGSEWGFRDWKVSGVVTLLVNRSFGPILWSQYTLSREVLKLVALFPPIGAEDAQTARLEIRRRNSWSTAAEASIDPLSRTALFRIEEWDDRTDVDYRVVYEWQGTEHEWTGVVRRDPRDEAKLKVGVFSCDHGECFPQESMVRNVKVQDPDLLFFAGDQIYEGHGGFGVARDKPTEEAMLDYLRKYWQHGWTWRELLRDRPSIVIPDDHDVFQGNVWGQGGRALPPTDGPRPMFENGGYLMPVDWVNAIQRTQAGHLPDSVDPTPLESGIEVYFTELRYGGGSFVVIEDRKFKTGPHDVLTEEQRMRADKEPAVADVDGAEMLGARQEDYLRRWTRESRDADFRIFCSQTIFCKATTHAGRDLKRMVVDLDCGGWPQTARNRALTIVRQARGAVMLAGDQHIGSLVRHGIEDWEDGPLAFMVPGTSNGFPRAWWPSVAAEDGRFLDGLGNRMTVLGAANPEVGSNTLRPGPGMDREEIAYLKGSGHGIVVFDRANETATFEMWRHGFDALSPRDEDQFEGFPQTLDL